MKSLRLASTGKSFLALLLVSFSKAVPAFALERAASAAVDGGVYTMIGNLTQVVLALVGGFMGFRILFVVFITQINHASGKPGALADSTIGIISALLLMQIAYIAPDIGAAAGNLALEAASPNMGAGELIQLFSEMIFNPLYELAIILAVSATLVIIVLLFFKAQISAMGGAVARLGESWMNAATAILILAFGFVAVRVGLSILGHAVHIAGFAPAA